MSEFDNTSLAKNKNNEKVAVALKYDSLDSLPKVVTSGIGEIALKILELAKENDIPVCEDTKLADILKVLPDGSNISEDSYKLVAEIICFLYETDNQWAKEHNFLDSLCSTKTGHK